MPKTAIISTTDTRVFAGLLALFGLLLAGLVWWAPGALLAAAVFTGVATLVSLAFNGETPRRRQALGLAFPALLAGLWLASTPVPVLVASAAIVAFVALAAAAFASPGLAARLRAVWMDAAAPIGWSVSAVLLAAVYFLVLTPIGLLRRLGARDPLGLRFERAGSYWIERKPTTDRRREYRQY